MITKTTRLATASRCARKRRITIWVWVRAAIVNSRSTGTEGSVWTAPPPAPGTGEPAGGTSRGSASLERLCGLVSAIADPRVEEGIQDIGGQVEQHDDDARHHQPCQHHVDVHLEDALYQQGAHPLPGEHRLGQDRAAEQGPGVDG